MSSDPDSLTDVHDDADDLEMSTGSDFSRVLSPVLVSQLDEATPIDIQILDEFEDDIEYSVDYLHNMVFAINKQLEHGQNIEKWCQIFSNNFNEIKNSKVQLNLDQLLLFNNQTLPSIIHSLMNLNLSDLKTFKIIEHFLRNFIDYSIHSFDSIYEKILDCLVKIIISTDIPLYVSNSRLNQTTAEFESDSEYISSIQNHLLEHFRDHGLSFIEEHINEMVPISIMSKIIKLSANYIWFINSDNQNEAYNHLVNVSISLEKYFKTLNESEINADNKNIFHSILMNICKMKEEVSSCFESMIKIELIIIHRHMKSTNIMLRIFSLVEFKRILQKTLIFIQRNPSLAYISSIICDFIHKENLISYLYHQSIHPELLTRSLDIIIFLCESGSLTFQDIDSLWFSIETNQHSSVTSIIYDQFQLIAFCLTFESSFYIIQKIINVKPNQIDSAFIEFCCIFLDEIFKKSFQPEDFIKVNDFTERIIWKLVESEPSLVLHNKLEFLTSKLLSSEHVSTPLSKEQVSTTESSSDKVSMRNSMISNCIESIRHRKHIDNIISIIRSILKQVEPKFGLEFLTKNQIIKLLFEDLHLLKQEWKQKPNPLIIGQLEIRLRFLCDLLTSFELLIQREDVITLFNDFINNSQIEIETIVYQFFLDVVISFKTRSDNQLLKTVNEGKQPTVNDTSFYILKVLFEDLLPNIEKKSISETGYKLLLMIHSGFNLIKESFILYNIQMSHFIPRKPELFLVKEESFIGKALISDICFYALSEHVSSEAMKLFASCFIYVPVESINQRCHDFISICMINLEQSETDLHFGQSLSLLKTFMELFRLEHGKEPNTLTFQQVIDCKTISLQIRAINIPYFYVNVKNFDSVSNLKKQIMEHCEFGNDISIRIFSNGKEWTQDQTFCSLNVVDKQIVSFIKRSIDPNQLNKTLPSNHIHHSIKPLSPSSPMENKMNLDSDHSIDHLPLTDYPSSILASEDYFKKLYSMLSLPLNRSFKIWEVLKLVPINDNIRSNILSMECDSKQMMKLLSGASLQVLYILYVLNLPVNNEKEWITYMTKIDLKSILIQLMKGFYEQPDFWIKFDAIDLSFRILATYSSHFNPLNPDTQLLFLKLITFGITYRPESPSFDFLNSALSILFAQKSNEIIFSRDLINIWSLFLVKHSNDSVRDQVKSRILNQTTQRIQESYQFEPLLDLLFEITPITHSFPFQSTQFYDLILSLFNYGKDNNNLSQLIITKFHSYLMESIIKYKSSETFNGEPDETICGYLKLLYQFNHDKFQSFNQETFSSFIFHNLLFNMDFSKGYPLCKSSQTRHLALLLLLLFIKSNKQISSQTSEFLNSFADSFSQKQGIWNYNPEDSVKARCGYVGLMNQGATCYMNSIMQQFYMIPNFRKGIFGLESDFNCTDDLVFQMVYLFSYLEESVSRYYDTTPFCHSYKDMDGLTMNVSVQMDVDEFFNGLFDQLEKMLKGKPGQKIFQQCFGGKLIQEIKSFQCPHNSEREEGFFAVQCEVKNKKNLLESFETYVQGENLDGDNKYYCGKCQSHVDALKRTSIKDPPNHLILHLKRFDFDMETLRRQKINDHFEFPLEFDLTPFTHDYIHKKELGENPNLNRFMYSLSGVLVHSGTADSGHYYSYIKQRGSEDWFQFNDSLVVPFSLDDLPSSAFGGSDHVSDTHFKSRPLVRYHNAYMLLVPITVPDNIVPPPKMSELIKQQNNTVLKRGMEFDPVLAEITREIAEHAPSGPIKYSYVFKYLLDIAGRSKVDNQADYLFKYTDTLVSINTEAAEIFLSYLVSNQKTILPDYLFSCYIIPLKDSFITIIGKAATKVCLDNNKKTILKLCKALVSFITDVSTYWRTFGHYFKLILNLIRTDNELLLFFLKENLVIQCIDIYLGEFSPVSDHLKLNRRSLGDQFGMPDFSCLLEILTILIPHHHLEKEMNRDRLVYKAVLGSIEIDKSTIQFPFFQKQLRFQHVESVKLILNGILQKSFKFHPGLSFLFEELSNICRSPDQINYKQAIISTLEYIIIKIQPESSVSSIDFEVRINFLVNLLLNGLKEPMLRLEMSGLLNKILMNPSSSECSQNVMRNCLGKWIDFIIVVSNFECRQQFLHIFALLYPNPGKSRDALNVLVKLKDTLVHLSKTEIHRNDRNEWYTFEFLHLILHYSRTYIADDLETLADCLSCISQIIRSNPIQLDYELLNLLQIINLLKENYTFRDRLLHSEPVVELLCCFPLIKTINLQEIPNNFHNIVLPEYTRIVIEFINSSAIFARRYGSIQPTMNMKTYFQSQNYYPDEPTFAINEVLKIIKTLCENGTNRDGSFHLKLIREISQFKAQIPDFIYIEVLFISLSTYRGRAGDMKYEIKCGDHINHLKKCMDIQLSIGCLIEIITKEFYDVLTVSQVFEYDYLVHLVLNFHHESLYINLLFDFGIQNGFLQIETLRRLRNDLGKNKESVEFDKFDEYLEDKEMSLK